MGQVCNATTPNELRKEIVSLISHRAWQERAVKDIGRTTKLYRAKHEHAAIALENLAAELTEMEIVNQWPAGLTESAGVKA
jgi:hypothetical protein